MKINIVIVIILIYLTNSAYAHHSREYILLTSFQTGAKGSCLFGLSYDSASKNKYYSWETTPAILYSLTNKIMFETHTHFRKEKNIDLLWEAVTFGTQVQLTNPNSHFLDLGLCFSFETPTSKSRDELSGENIFGLRLILSKELPYDMNICSNVAFTQIIENKKENYIEFIIGSKKPIISEKLECGIEMLGDFEKGTAINVLFGLYYSPKDNIIIKSGAGPGLTEKADDNLFSFQIMYNL
ncbi:hypothetical protein ACFL1R_10705 [Candidatus Latescibacterota bacterium]